jgi:hypothetical protein
VTNTELLNQLIEESGLKKKYIAEQLGITGYGLQRKIENQSEFKSSEISILCNVLNITSLKQKEAIFFANQVDYKSTKKENA